ncbi:MAG: metallophosphoesterase [Thermoguttaceae bacterium]|jgi:manganese-dependent ADP-ribose/CDP-alcohol diphosphatase
MIRFAAIADIQYGDQEDRNGRHYRGVYNKALAAAGEFSKVDIAFAMNFGDTYDRDWENAQAMKQLFDVSTNKGKVKWRHVLGNHEFSVPDNKKSSVYELFGLDKPGYYDFSLVDPDDANNKWRIIVLNGNEISLYTAETAEEKEEALAERAKRTLVDGSEPQSYNGSVSDRQLEWLEERLKAAEHIDENVLVCSHFPLYADSNSLRWKLTKLASPFNLGVYYSDLGVSTWNGDEILDVLDRHSHVRGYMSGHLHEGSYGERNGVAHITLRGLIEAETTAYAYVELEENSLRVNGKGEQPSYESNFENNDGGPG